MALVIADRVKETSTTTGTGTITLGGAVTGYQAFSVIGNGNQCYYTIVGIAVASEWEVGIGTYSSSTLTRDIVLASSAAGAKVSFSAGSKEVFVTYPADKAVALDVNDNVTLPGNLLVEGDIQNLGGSFTWDSATTSPASIKGQQQVITTVHEKMRGCVLNASGTVNYYLDPTDWSLKADGTASDLTGADGNVMVEIPKFYFRVLYVTTKPAWSISATPAAGFQVHPAFIKDGVEVDFRYYGAYDACVFDDSASDYISGTNLDNATALVDTTDDLLASVKGVYPMVGLTRNEFRLLAANNGSGWRQVDFALWSAVQMLYLIEYQTFNSQEVLGAGNTNGSYFASSSDQNDSPHTIAGAGDSIGSGSTDATSGAGVSAKPGTSFMKYRGIENFYGNCWNWADGINVNVTANGNVHVTNNRADFADNVSTNMELIATALPTASGFIRDLLPADGYFLSSSNSGASSTTYITDQHFASTSSNRVVRVGGNVAVGANAGAFCLFSLNGSGDRIRFVGGRLCW